MSVKIIWIIGCTLIISTNAVAQEIIDKLKDKISEQEVEIKSLRDQLRTEISAIKQEVKQNKEKLNSYARTGLVLFLFAGFSALWAQNTGRNAWLWFITGFFFSFITLIIILIKNGDNELNKRLDHYK